MNENTRPGSATVSLLLLVAGLALMGLASMRSGVQPDAYELATAGLATSAALGCFALGGALLTRRRLAEALLAGRGRRALGRGGVALVVVGMLGLSQLLDMALVLSGARQGSRLDVMDKALRGTDGPEVLLVVLGLALAPGIAEELLFRGLLLRLFSRIIGLPGALLVSSLLFGAGHLDAAQGTAAAILGLYLAAVVAVTGSIRTAVLCHVSNNLIAVASPLLTPEVPVASEISPAAAALLAVTTCALLWAVRRLARSMPEALRAWRRASGEEPG